MSSLRLKKKYKLKKKKKLRIHTQNKHGLLLMRLDGLCDRTVEISRTRWANARAFTRSPDLICFVCISNPNTHCADRKTIVFAEWWPRSVLSWQNAAIEISPMWLMWHRTRQRQQRCTINYAAWHGARTEHEATELMILYKEGHTVCSAIFCELVLAATAASAASAALCSRHYCSCARLRTCPRKMHIILYVLLGIEHTERSTG